MPKQYKSVTEATIRARLKHKYRLTDAQIAKLPTFDQVNDVINSELPQLIMHMSEAIFPPEVRTWMHNSKTIEEKLAGPPPSSKVPYTRHRRELVKNLKALSSFALDNLFAVHHQGDDPKIAQERNKRMMAAYRRVCTQLVEVVYERKTPKGRLNKLLVSYFVVPIHMIETMHNRPIEQIEGYKRPQKARKRKTPKPEKGND